jgi:hypothetical protein
MSVNTKGIDFAQFDMDEPEEGVVVQSLSARYSPDDCRNPDTSAFIPFTGILVGADYHPKPENPKRAFHDLVFRLTKPGVGVAGKGSDKKLVMLSAGDTLLVAATYSLKRWIEVALRENPGTVFELWVCALQEKEIGDDQTVWDYRVRIVKEHDPKTVFSASALLAEKPNAPAIASASQAS